MSDETREPGTEVAPVEKGGAVHRADVFGLMSVAAEKGMGLQDLKELFGLQKDIDARNARMAFSRALAAFRAECRQPEKTRENAQFSVTRNGVKRASRYSPLEEIDRVARPVAAKHGLSWTWDTVIDGELMHVTCKFFHEDGHMETSSVSMPYESKAGASPQQKYGSTQTYGMRYSLIAALGITTADDDVDGAETEPTDAPKIDADQREELEKGIDLSGADREKFLAWLGVESLDDLPASRFRDAKAALRRKAAEAAEK